jgi:hypothetical protein
MDIGTRLRHIAETASAIEREVEHVIMSHDWLQGSLLRRDIQELRAQIAEAIEHLKLVRCA